MHTNPHLNYPLSRIFLDRTLLMQYGTDSSPYAKAVNQWLEVDSPLCQKVRQCLRIPKYHVDHMRADIECKHLRSVMSSLGCRFDLKPSQDGSIIRFDRLAYLYEHVSHKERLELDRLFLCMLGSITLPNLLGTPVEAPEDDMSELTQHFVDVGFGDEQQFFCEYENQWIAAHLMPYRFALYRNVETFEDHEDPTPSYKDHLLAHGHSLEHVLTCAVEIVSGDRTSKDSIHIEYYGNDILMAYHLSGTLQWVHPNADLEECPAYWRDEYPLNLDDLMRRLMVLENKCGSTKVQENKFCMDLGL
ncbi:hypothetical protein IFT48_02005 [Pseudomonas fluorescens]|uniref:hypothetical protein n=1 Tax=Pseudomonas fluorescens TaxID=294 RepID=UPI001930A3E2|nr:hypothetical protein [Pseudomonas fluorescens]MBD8088736.1 hypothetical protein [Pseudomonas fluorescens]